MTCGDSGMSSSDCENMGCCVDSSTSVCYYPLDGKDSVWHFLMTERYVFQKLGN